MLIYPHLNPIAFEIGPLVVHWYGLMYLLAFFIAWLGLRYRVRQFQLGWDQHKISDLVFYAAVGVIIGGRLGYILFYNFLEFLHAPWIIFEVWRGGMSYHGGMIGVAIALWLWARHYQETYFAITDLVAPLVPLGLAFGRLGNFINGELWGRVTTLPWGMIYPHAGPLPRHPSEIYELLTEGVLLFIILWIYSNQRPPRRALSGAFLLGYGCFRIFCECFREPDSQLGFLIFPWLTMGQILSIPMVVLGGILLYLAYRKH